MANIDAANGFYPVRRLSGNGMIPMYKVLLGSNVGVKVGDAIALATTGLGALGTSTSAALLGIAQETITATVGVRQNVKYVPALPDIVFSGQCSGDCQITRIGEDVDIEGGTGVMEINENASSIDIARIIGLSREPAGNDWGTNARVEFIIRESAFTGQT